MAHTLPGEAVASPPLSLLVNASCASRDEEEQGLTGHAPQKLLLGLPVSGVNWKISGALRAFGRLGGITGFVSSGVPPQAFTLSPRCSRKQSAGKARKGQTFCQLPSSGGQCLDKWSVAIPRKITRHQPETQKGSRGDP